MSRKSLTVLGVSALLALAGACSKSSAPLTPTVPSTTITLPADGSTLKVTAPAPQSPTGGVKLTSAVVVLTTGAATPTTPGVSAAVQYRFEVLSAANAVVQTSGLINGLSWPVSAVLVGNATYTWHARAELPTGEVGPWSALASFVTVDPAIINDPLTNGRTVGQQIGGHFVAGGWQSDSVTDGINYDLPETCSDCRLEFDATNFGPQEGQPFLKDLKWVSMGDVSGFSDFGAFRDHVWKMHLVQRADFPSGIEIVWRNGKRNPDGDPGDHRIKLNSTPIQFSSSSVTHFQLDWSPAGYIITINGVQVMQDGWGRAYAPANHRIQLGCIPRAESFIGIIYRNVKLTNH